MILKLTPLLLEQTPLLASARPNSRMMNCFVERVMQIRLWGKSNTVLARIIARAIINFEGNFARKYSSIFGNINILENQVVLVDL